MGLELSTIEIRSNLRAMPEKVDRAVATQIEYYTPMTEAYAKVNAPWNDETTNARNGLRAFSEHAPGSHSITLTHSVYYGIFLETKENGKRPIILPTIREMGPRLMASLDGLFGRLR